jgi:hypothetical protein
LSPVDISIGDKLGLGPRRENYLGKNQFDPFNWGFEKSLKT